MAKGFRRKGNGYAGRLDADERALVTALMEQVLRLVEPEGRPREASGDEFDDIVAGLADVERPTDAADDPALQRLFPPGHHDDPAAAEEFRRLTEPSLRARKARNLSSSVETLNQVHGDRVHLDHDQAVALLVALTDVRLVIGERLGLVEDEDADRLERFAESLDMDDPVRYAVAVYDFLTWLQETLAHALLSGAEHGV